MFVFLAHEPARAIVGHVPGAENGLLVTGSEGVELLEQREELGGDFVEVDFGVDVDLGFHLFGQDVFGHMLLEAGGKLLDVLLLHREPHGVGVAAEVLEQVAARLHRLVDVESLYRAGRAGSQSVGEGEHHGRSVVEFGQA